MEPHEIIEISSDDDELESNNQRRSSNRCFKRQKRSHSEDSLPGLAYVQQWAPTWNQVEPIDLTSDYGDPADVTYLLDTLVQIDYGRPPALPGVQPPSRPRPEAQTDCDRRRKFMTRFTGRTKRQCPYYFDLKFGVSMYRGPGFEQFPVPTGYNPEHQIICDLWDANTKRKKNTYSSIIQAVPSTDGHCSEETQLVENGDEGPMEEDSPLQMHEIECLEKVFAVLPDISHQFVLDKFRSLVILNQDDQSLKIPGPDQVVTSILELKSYPKERLPDETNDETGTVIKFARGEQDQPKYLDHAIVLLAGEFHFVPTHYISRIAREKRSLYDAFLAIQGYEAAYRVSEVIQSPYKRLRQPRTVLEKKYTPNPNVPRNPKQWRGLITELQAAKQISRREEIKNKDRMEKEAEEAANLQRHIASGDVIECQCCFDDEIPVNRAIACEDGERHQYCFSCVERLAGSNTGSGKYKMLCMSQSGCKALLDAAGVSRAVPSSILRKLALNQQSAEVDAANIEGLEKCPHCDFKGICDPIEIDPIFSCQDPECRRMTCRICTEPAHTPKTCDEVKRERGITEKRHTVEEARSLAMMRTCPKCKKKAIKESGCNKLYCSCGGMSCFVCQKDISKEGYGHFGLPPKCPQSDSFNRHDRDADEAERSAIQQIRETNPEYAERDLLVHAKRKLGGSKRSRPTAELAMDNQMGRAQRAHEALERRIAEIDTQLIERTNAQRGVLQPRDLPNPVGQPTQPVNRPINNVRRISTVNVPPAQFPAIQQPHIPTINPTFHFYPPIPQPTLRNLDLAGQPAPFGTQQINTNNFGVAENLQHWPSIPLGLLAPLDPFRMYEQPAAPLPTPAPPQTLWPTNLAQVSWPQVNFDNFNPTGYGPTGYGQPLYSEGEGNGHYQI